MEIRCSKKAVSRTSPVDAVIFLPRDCRKTKPDWFIGPKVSKAKGTNSYDKLSSVYLATLLAAALSAADPAEKTERPTYEGHNTCFIIIISLAIHQAIKF